MKKLIIRSVLIVIFSGSICIGKAQTSNTNIAQVIIDPSLQGQYKELLEKSNSIKDYRVVKAAKLSSFWRNSMDTIKNERRELAKAKIQLQTQAKAIKALNQDLAINDKSLAESKAMIDEVKFLGISVSKSSYQIIMWGLILALSGGLGIITFLAKGYRKEATYRITLFQDLSEEFQTHKIKANEKEKRLARELQTEKNKLEEAGNY